MTARLPLFLLMLSALAALLAACGSAPAAAQERAPVEDSPAPSLTLEDTQGAVSVAVTPLDLDSPADVLEFTVAMNTHSVDLSMDLLKLAHLTTDTGLTVTPLAWDAPAGGHHVSGTLVFPDSIDGQALLDGATQLTLTIRDVDAPERIFVWQIGE